MSGRVLMTRTPTVDATTPIGPEDVDAVDLLDDPADLADMALAASELAAGLPPTSEEADMCRFVALRATWRLRYLLAEGGAQ